MTGERGYAIGVNKNTKRKIAWGRIKHVERLQGEKQMKTDLERAVSTNGSCASVVHHKHVLV